MFLVLHVCELNLAVDGFLVHVLDLLLSLLVDGPEYLLIIRCKRLILHLPHDFWVLWKHLLVQRLLGEGKALDFLDQGHVDELGLALVHNVVVAD